MTTLLEPLDLRLIAGPEAHFDDGAFERELAERRRRLAERGDSDPGRIRDLRRFPVLAVVAPVMTTRGGEVSYPGDPMCLYAALSVAIRGAVESLEAGLDDV